ncbi:DUF3822 family protein [Pelobium manganitolerans]|nr:DUF3822 family protein [Pelobium manganitolerans]
MNEQAQAQVEDFDITQAKTHELYLEVGANYFKYAVVNPENKAVRLLSHKASNLYNGLHDDWLRSHFAKTKISLSSQKFTFVPSALFHESATQNFVKYIGATDHDEVCVHHLTDAQLTIIYALPKLQLDKIHHYFPNAEIYPQIAPLFKGINFGFSQIFGKQIFINLRDTYAEILIMADKQFVFYNLFEYQNQDELLYFALLCAQENDLKPASTTLKISGLLGADSELMQRLQHYFTHTEMIDQDSLPLNTSQFEKPIVSSHFSLLALHLCGL